MNQFLTRLIQSRHASFIQPTPVNSDIGPYILNDYFSKNYKTNIIQIFILHNIFINI